MTATTEARDTPRRDGADFSYPAGAAKTILQGTLVVLDGTTGNAEMATTATGKVCVGMAKETVDNSAGGAGALSVPVRRGVFRFANSASADEIKRADIGTTCYLVDNQTVAKTNGSTTRSAAGIVRDVDAAGVWVEI